LSSQIISDSTSYLPQDILNEYGIITIPLNIQLDGKSYKEGQDILNDKFYSLLRTSNDFPSTSQPPTGEFLKVFRNLQPNQEALVILISSELSGTVQSALMARSMLEPDLQSQITIIDSRTTAGGLGFQLIKAGEMLVQGKTTTQVAAELERIQAKQDLFFVVDNLEYLVRGGRLGKKSGLIGNLLQLKPVLHLQNGRIELFNKVRTSTRALKTILDQIELNYAKPEKLCVIHVQAEEKGKELQNILQTQYGFPVLFCEAGPVIGSHVGPGALGIAVY
jgi:DegV family protein with EDD domain